MIGANLAIENADLIRQSIANSEKPMRYQITIRISLLAFLIPTVSSSSALAQHDDGTLPDQTYMPVVADADFDETLNADKNDKSKVMKRQADLLGQRYDLSDRPSETMMSGKRKAVQSGVRVKLPESTTWDQLRKMSPDEIKQNNLFPMGFRPLPHAKHAVGGMVFPKQQIDAIEKAESRDLQRFDVEFDLPDHLTPEFPPPIFLTSRPDLGDVSQGKVLTNKNYYELMKGKLTPVQWKVCGSS